MRVFPVHFCYKLTLSNAANAELITCHPDQCCTEKLIGCADFFFEVSNMVKIVEKYIFIQNGLASDI